MSEDWERLAPLIALNLKIIKIMFINFNHHSSNYPHFLTHFSWALSFQDQAFLFPVLASYFSFSEIFSCNCSYIFSCYAFSSKLSLTMKLPSRENSFFWVSEIFFFDIFHQKNMFIAFFLFFLIKIFLSLFFSILTS